MSSCSSPSVAEILRSHVTLELEGIDRMYLNVYIPKLQYPSGVAAFLRYHRGAQFASSVLLQPIRDAFLAKMEAFTEARQIPVITFRKGQRKDDLAKEALAGFPKAGGREGVLFVGKAQEKTPVIRTEKRFNERTGRPYPWLVSSTAMVNHWYWYGVDADVGPFFLKVCTYFPYTVKVCLNGHEYLKRQLAHEGIVFEALDNGLLSCADPKRAQAICDRRSAEKIEGLVRKWLRFLPSPFTPADTRAGYRYDVSVLQAEFSLTQVLDRPATGRQFFEEVMRENLDIGRPSQVQLIFNRRVTRRTPGRFRTRVLTEGVTPSLHLDYKRSRIKPYHKEGRALRTETTINNTRDFAIGRRLTRDNLAALRRVGFQANRRLLDVERLSHDCAVGDTVFTQLHQPIVVDDQRASALRFGDPRVQLLLCALVCFRLLPQGFSHADLTAQLTFLLGAGATPITAGRMTYDLRRLRLHGVITRIPKTHRYRLTDFGLRAALFSTRSYARLIRPGLALVVPDEVLGDPPLRRAFQQLECAMDTCCEAARLSA
jgi:hypothetical protein